MFGTTSIPRERDEDLMEVEDAEADREASSPETARLHRLGEMVSSKESSEAIRQAFDEEFSSPPDQATSFAEARTAYAQPSVSDTVLLQALCRILLLCGDKNVTHTAMILARYRPLLTEIAGSVNDRSEEIWVDAVMDVWSTSIHRASLVLTLLMRREMIQATTVVQWSLQRIQQNALREDRSVAQWLDVLQCGLSFGESCVKEAESERAAAMVRVRHARESAQDAATRAAEAAERLESGATESVQDTIDAINDANVAEEKARIEVDDAETHLQETQDSGINDALGRFQTVFMTVVLSAS